MQSRKQDHDFVVKSLTTIVKNCEKREIDAEVVVQTMLSVALTVAISTSNIEDVANLLESLAAGIRRLQSELRTDMPSEFSNVKGVTLVIA
jgi:hypothetical protein